MCACLLSNSARPFKKCQKKVIGINLPGEEKASYSIGLSGMFSNAEHKSWDDVRVF